MIDLYLTPDGDFEVGADGDLRRVSGDAAVAQEVIFRLRTTKGDYLLVPSVGASLEDFIGQPNTEETRALIEARIEEELTRDLLLAFPDISAVEVPAEGDPPGQNTGVLILIEFSSIEDDAKLVQVSALFDMKRGSISARSSTRQLI